MLWSFKFDIILMKRQTKTKFMQNQRSLVIFFFSFWLAKVPGTKDRNFYKEIMKFCNFCKAFKINNESMNLS